MKREVEDRLLVVMEAILEKITYNYEHQSRTSEMLATGVTNNVLEISTRQFGLAVDGTNAVIPLSYQATVGSIEIHNSGSNRITVVNSTSGSRALIGIGVSHIEPGTGRTLNVNSRNVTLWGIPGDLVGIQAYTVGGAGPIGGSSA